MSTIYQYPIVGTRFHPPANAILAACSADIPLQLCLEPSNPHDENAIMVWLDASNIPLECYGELDNLSRGYSNWSMDRILSTGMLHLGYIPRTVAARLKEDHSLPEKWSGTLVFGSDGGGKVRFELDD
jgi:hypothetical protein